MKRNDGTARYESKKAMLKKRREGALEWAFTVFAVLQ